MAKYQERRLTGGEKKYLYRKKGKRTTVEYSSLTPRYRLQRGAGPQQAATGYHIHYSMIQVFRRTRRL